MIYIVILFGDILKWSQHRWVEGVMKIRTVSEFFQMFQFAPFPKNILPIIPSVIFLYLNS